MVPLGVAGRRSVVVDEASGVEVREVGGVGANGVSMDCESDVVATAHRLSRCVEVMRGSREDEDERARVDVGGVCWCVEVVGGGMGVLGGGGVDVVLIRLIWDIVVD